MDFSSLHPDVIRNIALELPVVDIIDNCRLNRQFNNAICNNIDIWKRLARDRLNYTADQVNTLPLRTLKYDLYRDEITPAYYRENNILAFLEDKRIGEARHPRSCVRYQNLVEIPPDQVKAWQAQRFEYPPGSGRFKYRQVLPFPSPDHSTVHYYGCKGEYPFPYMGKGPAPRGEVYHVPCCFAEEKRPEQLSKTMYGAFLERSKIN